MGKPVKYARAVDVNSAANCVRWYGERSTKFMTKLPRRQYCAGAHHTWASGVVGVIVPWNYPMIMASWKIAPALRGQSWCSAQREITVDRVAHG